MLRTIVCVLGVLASVLPSIAAPVRIRGRVVDARTQQPLPSASVAVIDRASGRVDHGVIAQRTGTFEIGSVLIGQHTIRITYTGYDTTSVDPATFTPDHDVVDLKDVLLSPTEHSTDEVAVIAEKDQITYAPGKKVFNVDKTLTTAGGNALDVLRQVPSVSVDMNGAVTVRGSGAVNIYVDNKPITAYGDPTMVLKSLPAAALQTVEVISNPGSKYDAEGQAGILNIVLRKEREQGLNGTTVLNMGLFDNYSGQLSGNYRDASVNYLASVDLATANGRRYKRAESWFDNGLSVYRDGGSLAQNTSVVGKAGAEITLSPHHRMSVTGDLQYSGGTSSDPFYSTITASTSAVTTATLDQHSESAFLSGGATIDYAFTDDVPTNKLTAMLMVFPTTFDVTSTSENSSPQYGRRARTYGSSMYVQAQSDYSTTIHDSSVVEAGAKALLQTINSDFLFSNEDAATGAWVPDVTTSNGAYHVNNVYAGYVNYANKLGDLSFQAGLRGEYTVYVYEGRNVGSQNFARSYGNLFPSVALSYQLSDEGSLNWSYSRRINRPDDTQLNPFLDRSDSLNWRTGNPALLPEFTNSFELGYLHAMPAAVLNAEVFYRHTTDHINLRFRQQVGPATILERPYNFGYADSYGASLYANLEPTDWLKVNTEVSYYAQDVVGDIFDQHFASYGHGWNAKASAIATLPFDMRGQLNFDYTAPQVIPQGYRYAFTFMSVALNKQFLDKALTVGLSWTDPFNTARFGGVVNGQGFSTELLNQRDYPLVTLSVTYRLNNARAQQQRGVPGGALVGGASSKI